jgi:hypothetical protein
MENGSLQTDENRARTRENGDRKHRDSFKKKKLTAGIDHAIRVACDPHPVTQQRLLKLFDGRASLAIIKQWRYGWCRPPAWAADLLKAKLDVRLRQLYQVLAALEKQAAGGNKRGAAGAKALAAWRERKARERDEKEKAARERAALNQQPD